MRSTSVLLAGIVALAGCSEAPKSTKDPKPSGGPDKVSARSDDPYTAAALNAVKFLRTHQNPDGGFGSFKGNPSSSVGVTSLVAYAMMVSPAKLTEASSPELAKAIQFIVTKQDDSGCIVDPKMNLANYNTSVGAMALVRTGNPAHADAIAKAKAYLRGIQLDEENGVDRDNPFYGGAPYGPGKKVSDGSNTGMWMDAMKELGLEANDPAMQNALVFMQRISNNSEVNDQPWAKNPDPADAGGAVYRPAEDVERSKDPKRDAEGRKVDISKKGKRGLKGWKSYGSMTYQMFKGFIYAGRKKGDAGVDGAIDWIGNNWTLDENPGIGAEGQFYYYRVFARAHGAFGERMIAGHDCAKELADKLVTLQKDDGSWTNPKGRWMEGDPALATAFALEALSIAIEEIGRDK
jgi:squalene-hopene/tetraprenyl-beta-curcumene cyclase